MRSSTCRFCVATLMVTVPGGFHPNVGCPGGHIGYLYVMAARVAGEREFMALRFQEEFGDSF